MSLFNTMGSSSNLIHIVLLVLIDGVAFSLLCYGAWTVGRGAPRWWRGIVFLVGGLLELLITFALATRPLWSGVMSCLVLLICIFGNKVLCRLPPRNPWLEEELRSDEEELWSDEEEEESIREAGLMPEPLLFLLLYYREVAHLRDEGRMMAWLRALEAEGMRLDLSLSPRDHSAGPEAGETLSPADRAWYASVEERVRVFCRGECDGFSCYATAPESTLLVQVWVDTYLEVVALTVSDTCFGEDERGQQNYHRFINLARATYHTWHPLFGFLMEPCLPDTTREQALAHETGWLHNILLFGPDYVTRLGRNRILMCSAWKVEPLDDGGMLVASVPYTKDGSPRGPYQRQEVAVSLGIPFNQEQFNPACQDRAGCWTLQF